MLRPVVSGLLSLLTTCPDPKDNEAPVIHEITLGAVEDTPFVIQRGQLDISDPDGDAVYVRLQPPASGTIVGDDNGPWTYTPSIDFTGRDQVLVQVTDGLAGAEAWLSLDVPANESKPVVWRREQASLGIT